MHGHIFSDIAAVVIVSSLLAWLSLYIRQPIIVAYILAGIIMGPWGLKIIEDVNFINETSHIGVTLLLFLAGLTLEPGRIPSLLKKTILVTGANSIVFGSAAFGVSYAFGFSMIESLITGTAFMFSSTILVLKLLPTITLHQKHMGALSIAILILQDILAVTMLMFAKGGNLDSTGQLALTFFYAILIAAAAVLAEKYLIRLIFKKIQYYQELLYLFTLAWCFSIALLTGWIGLGYEIGAFIAGLSLANNPVSGIIFEGLRFFRDFFLVLFFFALGALLDFGVLQSILWPVIALSLVTLLIKPGIFDLSFRLMGETKRISREMGVRLGQASEFSLILGFTAYSSSMIGKESFQLIQFSTILTLIISSYIVVLFYPTPLASDRALKQD